jgi:hypothetical protein
MAFLRWIPFYIQVLALISSYVAGPKHTDTQCKSYRGTNTKNCYHTCQLTRSRKNPCTVQKVLKL